MAEKRDTGSTDDVREQVMKAMAEAILKHEKELLEYLSEQPHDTLFKAAKRMFRK